MWSFSLWEERICTIQGGAANQIREYFDTHTGELRGLKDNQKSSSAADSLMDLYDFQILYDKDPIGFYTYDDFSINKERLKSKITEIEIRLSQVIEI